MNDNEIAEERAAERRYTEALNRRTVRALQRLWPNIDFDSDENSFERWRARGERFADDDMRRKVIAELRARVTQIMRRKVIAELRARVTQINPKSETLKLLDEIEKGP